jgi:hypothetical protein
MKSRILLAVFFCFQALIACAQFQKLEIEEVENSGKVPGRTYRVYAVLEKDSDQVYMIFGDEQHPLFIRSTAPFYQNPFGAPLSTGIIRKLLKEKETLKFDSWLTIGSQDNYENSTQVFLINLQPFDSLGAEIQTSNGAWFSTPDKPQGRAGSSHKVLLMQLTTKGVITGRLSLQGRNGKGQVWNVYDQEFSTGKK